MTEELDTGANTVKKTFGWVAPEGADPFNHYMVGYGWNNEEFTVPAVSHLMVRHIRPLSSILREKRGKSKSQVLRMAGCMVFRLRIT